MKLYQYNGMQYTLTGLKRIFRLTNPAIAQMTIGQYQIFRNQRLERIA